MANESAYAAGLDRNGANYTALTPVSFLNWAADVYPERVAVIHGAGRYSWRQVRERARRFASALAGMGVGANDTVALLLANTPAMYEAHFAIPMTGGVINTLNTRLDAAAIAFLLRHGEAKVIVTDKAYSEVMGAAIAESGTRAVVIDVDDSEYDGPGERLGTLEYEALLAGGDPDFVGPGPGEEWDAIALSYTSGTTGDPKGVVTHHRGAYLNAISNILCWEMGMFPVYLWTVPMFHCNGWCFPWSIAARAGTNVMLRKFDGRTILEAIRDYGVTHFGGAPVVQQMVLTQPEELKAQITHRVDAMVAGAAPPAAVIEGMEGMGFRVTHIYGLTETYGPAAVCARHPEWEDLELGERARMYGRQGVRSPLEEGMTVMDTATMQETPADGETMGEVMFRGNLTMKGYLKNARATEACFAGGWFHTGDLAVRHEDGYIKIKDRSKDIIISGGENISSLEVEDVLHRHPAVLAAAVVAQPDKVWGESPVAYVELRDGAAAEAGEVIAFCRERMAHFKCPKRVEFGALPRTSTGKIQKYVLRERAGSASAIDV
jgi:fatty-acyl-CoA synthase